jgi:hypothetical protein
MARIQQDRSAMMSALRPDALRKDGDGVSGYRGSGCSGGLAYAPPCAQLLQPARL